MGKLLADNHENLGRTDNIKRPRGRPSSFSTPSPSPPPKKKTAKELKPYQEIRYDNIGHLTSSDEKQMCKMENCGGKTHVMCQKCNIHLCFVVNFKDCFTTFHTKK